MNFQQAAEEKFGKERAEEIDSDIEQLRADIDKLRSLSLDFDDEA